MKKLTFTTFLIVILFLHSVIGQQVISGQKINKSVSWSGTIIIEGDVIVQKNARLTIEPGTKVLFRPQTDKTNSGADPTRSELMIYGVLKVDGKPGTNGKVLFSSASKQPRMGDWYGIQLVNKKELSVIDYATIEYAYNGLTIKKNNSVIRNSHILLNYNAGISCEVKAGPKINANYISENGYAGIITSLGSKPILAHNIISSNEIGIIVFKTSKPNLGNLARGNNYNEGRNRIFDNIEYDFYNHSNEKMLAENNFWGSTLSALASRIHGSVDYQPFGENLDNFFEIPQETAVSQVAQTTEQKRVEPEQQSAQNAEDQEERDQTGSDLPNQGASNLTLATTTPSFTVNNNEPEKEPENNLEKDTVKKEEKVIPAPRQKAETTRPIAALEQNLAELQINYDQIFLEHFLDGRKAEIVKKVAPKISSFGPKGRVIVRAVIDKNGNVESASVVRGLDLKSDEVSLKAARKFKYKQGSVKGVPVKFYTNILFEF